MKRVWKELDSKDKDFVVSYNMKVKHNKSTYGIDVPDKFRAQFKDKYSTPRENQSRSRRKVIFNLYQYNN